MGSMRSARFSSNRPSDASGSIEYNLDAKDTDILHLNTLDLAAVRHRAYQFLEKGVDMTRQRIVESIASGFGLTGMALGSTTPYGIACYAVAVPCLVFCVYKKKLWGLMMLNVAQGVVIAFNAWRVM